MVRKKKPALATKRIQQGNVQAVQGDIWILKEAVQTMNGNIRILTGDIQIVRGDLQKLEKRMDTKMDELRGEIDIKFEKFAAELKHHMNVVAENLVHDFKGIFKDRLEQHEDRIIHLEKHVGLVRV